MADLGAELRRALDAAREGGGTLEAAIVLPGSCIIRRGPYFLSWRIGDAHGMKALLVL
jgi:hypothetical protein